MAEAKNLAPTRMSDSNRGHLIQVVGYRRVSTYMQAQHGLSLDAQQDLIRRYAADRGWVMLEIFVDRGFSAKNTDRPAFQRMAWLSERLAKTRWVVVSKLDA